jgi:DHA2 family multidrug resistance protein
MSLSPTQPVSPNPAFSRGLITITVMLTTIMVILDMTIVNVALPDMMGALGATSDQITWVLTSYIVAEAIMIPLTGFLVTLFGRKRLMLVSVAGFIIASALCGQADSLAEMIVFRLIQGICGASVIPLSQSVMVDVFPKEERGKAMALWGIGIMLGPILGPTLGGYITEHRLALGVLHQPAGGHPQPADGVDTASGRNRTQGAGGLAGCAVHGSRHRQPATHAGSGQPEKLV